MMINDLIAHDREQPRKLFVVGDAMQDVWLHGSLGASQDGCMKTSGQFMQRTPGGAANAARQLVNWYSTAFLVALNGSLKPHDEVDTDLCLDLGVNPMKTRFVDEQGRIVFRHDDERPMYGLTAHDLDRARQHIIDMIREHRPNGVLISDYAKGLLDEPTLREVIDLCNRRGIVVVADAKRRPGVYRGAILKCNGDYYDRYTPIEESDGFRGLVMTDGPNQIIAGATIIASLPEVVCRNHVGAGDCFAAHLLLGLCHGLTIPEAADVAYSAGRVYVQHEHGRPPWPHEIRKDISPIGGKLVSADELSRLSASLDYGTMVFTNGVFRIPHAGHAWLLDRARKEGGCLVVGINDDESAARLRPGEYVMPLNERVACLAAQAAVDWIIPFTEDTPEAIMGRLRPDALVKGHEYAGRRVPGDEIAKEVVFASPGPFSSHSSDLAEEISARK